ncbi:MAG: hypothetical protein JXR25_09320 [Pontiellaceae bacterium]|nr:hypothetical protein [Pontiellaceae bacterium]MBN2785015.1 hypothetical protein [Pontiellaceae bacterium]
MRLRIFALGAILLSGLVNSRGGHPLSPVDVLSSPGGDRLYVACGSGQRVLCVDTTGIQVDQEIMFDHELTGLELSQDGQQLYVTAGGLQGSVLEIDTETGNTVRCLDAGHTPMAPQLSPDEKTLYVCNRFDNDVTVVDLERGETVARIPVVREPVAADLSPDGRLLFVANLLPSGAANVKDAGAVVSVIDTTSRKTRQIPLIEGSTGVRGIKVSPDGSYAVAVHHVAHYQVPATQLERGWVMTSAISFIRVSDLSLLYTVLLDDAEQGFPNPWAIGFSGDGNTLVVSSAGLNQLSLIQVPELFEKLKLIDPQDPQAVAVLGNDLSFLSGIRRRIGFNGVGPRALAVVGNCVYVANYFSDSVDGIDFSFAEGCTLFNGSLGPDVPLTDERRGEILFNDARDCFQNWLSCASCHPDARTDGLNWDLPNDGVGNPKNAKSMLLAHVTPAAMWLGVRADAETGVRAGLRHIEFSVRPEDEARCIDAYLKSLHPVPSPFRDRETGALTVAAERGKLAFETVGCAGCHPAPLFTDLQMRDVGTLLGRDEGRLVDTPQLVEVWRTAPYLHDGRAATLGDVLGSMGHAGISKAASGLSKEELDDLLAYIRSL